MPREYEQIRSSYVARGKSYDEAQSIAAATYNKRRKPGQAPVTGHHSKKRAHKRTTPRILSYGKK